MSGPVVGTSLHGPYVEFPSGARVYVVPSMRMREASYGLMRGGSQDVREALRSEWRAAVAEQLTQILRAGDPRG